MTNPISPVNNRPSSSDFRSFVDQIVADLERFQAEGTWAVYTRLSHAVQNMPSYSLEFQPGCADQYTRWPYRLYHEFANDYIPVGYCNDTGTLAGNFSPERGHFLKLSAILYWIILTRDSSFIVNHVHHAQIGETHG